MFIVINEFYTLVCAGGIVRIMGEWLLVLVPKTPRFPGRVAELGEK